MKKFGDAFSKDLAIIAVVEQGKKEVEGKATSIIEASLKELEKKGAYHFAWDKNKDICRINARTNFPWKRISRS